MLPHAHFRHELPELPTISFLHLDYPYAQAVPPKAIAMDHAHRSSILPRLEVKHGQPGREGQKGNSL
jgi:hypothetical protein